MFLILPGDWRRDMRVSSQLPKYNLVKYTFRQKTSHVLHQSQGHYKIDILPPFVFFMFDESNEVITAQISLTFKMT